MKGVSITICFLGVVAIIISTPILVVSFQRGDFANAVTVLETLISIGLAVVSIWYSYRTNEKTAQLLERIEDQNRRLVDKINRELVNDNYDDANIRDILDEYDEILANSHDEHSLRKR